MGVDCVLCCGFIGGLGSGGVSVCWWSSFLSGGMSLGWLAVAVLVGFGWGVVRGCVVWLWFVGFEGVCSVSFGCVWFEFELVL